MSTIESAVGDEQPAQEAPTADRPSPAPSDAIVDEWVARRLHNSPVSRATEAMNYLTLVAIPALKTALKG